MFRGHLHCRRVQSLFPYILIGKYRKIPENGKILIFPLEKHFLVPNCPCGMDNSFLILELKIPKKEYLNAPIKNILKLTSELQPLDQLYTIKECLKALLDKEKKVHMMNETFCTGQTDDLNEAYDLMNDIYDDDPTPQHLWDNSGGEPPVTLNEMYNQAYKEKYGI